MRKRRFEIADFGVVGNLFDIVPALTEEVKKRSWADRTQIHHDSHG
jgi:hypothetical protein